MKHRINGWDRARRVASSYVSTHEGEPGALDLKKVTLIARKWLVGFKGGLVDLHAFERHVSDLIRNSKKPPVVPNPSVELLKRKVADSKRLEAMFTDASDSSVLDSDLLIAISQFVSRVGFDRLEKHIQVVKSIRAL